MRRHVLLLLLLVLALPAAFAQPAAPPWPSRTGHAWVDRTLGDVDRYGVRYPDAFIDELVRYHATPRALASDLLVARRWAPGDVYVACALAQVAGEPCRAVADAWSREPAAGWAPIMQRLGVTPDSARFERLERALVDSYQRWGRPLPAAAPAPVPPPSARPTPPAAAPPSR